MNCPPPPPRQRNSWFELLRIISMVMIIIHHYALHGFDLTEFSGTKIFIDFLTVPGKWAVNCFVLITGFYMIRSRFSFKKILLLEGQVLFYSVGLTGLIALIHPESVSLKAAVTSFFPLFFYKYWFFTAYVVLLFLSPFLNKAFFALTKRQVLIFILIFSILWSVSSTFFYERFYGSRVPWFVLLYVIGAFVRCYTNPSEGRASRYFAVGVGFLFLCGLSTIVLNFLGYRFGIELFLRNATVALKDNSFFLLVSAAATFIGFSKLPPKHNRAVNLIAGTVFGVYLIHEYGLVQNFLWNDVFHSSQMVGSPYLPLHFAAAVISVFSVGVIIDLIRKNTFERLYLKILDRWQPKAEQWRCSAESWLDRLISKISPDSG